MLLSPEAARVLDSHCVLFAINVFPSDPEQKARLEELRAWVRREAPWLTPVLDERVDIGPYVLGPDGRVLEQVRRPEDALPMVLAAAVRAGVEPGRRVVRSGAPWFQAYEPGDLAMKLTSRFLETDDFRLPSPPPWQVPMTVYYPSSESNMRMYRARLRSPTREGVVLAKARTAALFPSDATSWTLPPEVAVDLLWLFRPSTHQYRLEKTDVEEATLRAVAEERQGDRQRVRLEGRVVVRQWWYPRSGEGFWLGDRLSEEFHAESPVVGYADLDPARREVRNLRLVSDGGAYRGVDGTFLPFETVLYSVTPEEAAASCGR